jgi:hypothetical protein
MVTGTKPDFVLYSEPERPGTPPLLQLFRVATGREPPLCDSACPFSPEILDASMSRMRLS